VVVLLVIALLLGIALSWVIIHSIRHPLNSMRDSSQQLAQSRGPDAAAARPGP
jgi:methyl-accepting chemotaxis protein